MYDVLVLGGRRAYVSYSVGGEAREATVDAVIMATGWAGSIDELGLDRAGVRAEKSYVLVDGNMQTNIDSIYAAGDVGGKTMVVQNATNQARIAVEHAVEIVEMVAAGMSAGVRVDQPANVEDAYPTFSVVVGVAARDIVRQLGIILVSEAWRETAGATPRSQLRPVVELDTKTQACYEDSRRCGAPPGPRKGFASPVSA